MSDALTNTNTVAHKRGASRRAAWALLWGAFPGRLGAIAALTLLGGALPAVFATLVARLVALVPRAVSGGYASPDGQRIVTTLIAIGGVLLTVEIVVTIRGLAVSDLYRRYDEYLLARVMRGTLAPPLLELYEDPDLAATTDRAVRIARYGPGELVSGTAAKWSVQAQGLAATVLVATVWPLAAVGLAVVWLLAAQQMQADYYRANPFWADPLRRARYLKQLALMPPWAKELRIFGLAQWLGDRFGRQWALVMEELWRARRADQRIMTLVLAAILVANGIVLTFAAQAALRGTLSVATVTILIQGLFGMAFLANQEGDVWIENGAVPVPDVLAFERTIATHVPPTRTGIDATGMPREAIRCENVRFGYPGRATPVYEHLDLQIDAGRSLAIVGLNGAGKTTLIKLLTGLQQPQSGRITIDGVDLRELDAQSWRRSVAAIFQDFVHYELPAVDNIGWGAVEQVQTSNRDAIVATAIERAGAGEIVAALPGGLQTTLSRRFVGGVDLSGGQWQRIALARAMAAVQAGACVLVLDEPTAHLDVRAEADLYDRFLDITAGLTTIVISHRFSTVRRADRIVVLDGGRITEDGTHAELLAAGGRYAQLFEKQAMRYAATDAPDDTAEDGDD